MQVIYKPRLNPDWSPIPGQEVAAAILLPYNYDPNKKYPWGMFAHGKGERSGGTLEHLENLVLGQKQPDGTRRYPFVKEYHKEAVDKYGIIFVIPTYEDGFYASKINWLHDYILKNYSVVYKMAGGGFSLGGGAFVDYAINIENAKKMAVCIPCAPTSNLGSSVSYPGTLPMHIFCATRDTNSFTNIDVTKSIVTKLNKSNPGIKVQYTAFDINDHQGFDQATTITPPVAPNGQGVINLNENIYDWYLDVLANGPRQMRSGAVVDPIPPIPPIPPTPVLKAEFNLTDGQLLTTNTYDLDASASTGVKAGGDSYVWNVEVKKAPSSESYGVTTENVYDGDPKNRLIRIVDGEYSVKLTVKGENGTSASKTVNIIVNTSGIKIVKGFDSTTDLITYTDGTTEKGTVVLSSGKWVLKNSAGQVIN